MSAWRRNPSRLGITLYTESALERAAALALVAVCLLIASGCKTAPALKRAGGPPLPPGLANFTPSQSSILKAEVSQPAFVELPGLRFTSAAIDEGHLSLTWQGGSAPYQLQSALTPQGPWSDLGEPTSASSALLPIDSNQSLYRLKTVVPSGQSKWAIKMGGLFVEAKADITGAAVNQSHELIVAGVFTGSVDVGGQVITNPSTLSSGIFLAKYSQVGGLIWVKNLANGNLSKATKVVIDQSGDAVICGYFQTAINFGAGTVSGAGDLDIFIAKYSGVTGALIWAKPLGGTSGDQGYDVCLDGTNIVATGAFKETVFGIGTSAGYFDAFVVKLNGSNGATIWAKHFGSTGDDRGIAVSSANGGVVVMGFFSGTVDFGGVSRTSHGSEDLYLAKFDESGNLLWVKNYGGTAYVSTTSGAVSPSGEIVVTGIYAYGTLTIGSNAFPAPATPAIFLAKFDSSGNPIWSRTFGGTSLSSDNASGVAIDGQGEVYLTGTVRNAIDFGGGYLFANPITVDPFAAKFGSAGQHRFSSRYASVGSDYDYSNVVALDGDAMIIGGSFTGQIDFGSPVGLITPVPGGYTDSYLLALTH